MASKHNGGEIADVFLFSSYAGFIDKEDLVYIPLLLLIIKLLLSIYHTAIRIRNDRKKGNRNNDPQ